MMRDMGWVGGTINTISADEHNPTASTIARPHNNSPVAAEVGIALQGQHHHHTKKTDARLRGECGRAANPTCKQAWEVGLHGTWHTSHTTYILDVVLVPQPLPGKGHGSTHTVAGRTSRGEQPEGRGGGGGGGGAPLRATNRLVAQMQQWVGK